MGLRPGYCYRHTRDRAYTRHAEKVQEKDYIGAVPGLKTRQWNMGNGQKEFDTILDLIVRVPPMGIQIRDNAIESARLMINRQLIKLVGKEEFFLKLRVYSYHILRENKQAQGAHADRIQKGMSHAFGKTIGRAVRVRDKQKIFSVLVNDEFKEKAKKALMYAKARFPCKIEVIIHKDVQSIGTKPKKTRDIIAEEETAKAAAASTITSTTTEASKTETKKEETKTTEKKTETKTTKK
jgi:large subunit ribosomal protein L10e